MGDVVCLNYDDFVFLENKFATRIVNVNPFAVVNWIGQVELNPATDTWIETRRTAATYDIEGSFNSMMGIPPVVVGLIVYLLVSRSGPLGWLEILYTPYAMILAQVFLILPIIISLSTQIFEELHREYKDFFTIFSVPPNKSVITYITDSKDSLITIFLAGFGRAISEVGAVIIVGGNIDHVTRVMTTTIALETSKGDLPFALALGIILLFISLIINIIATKMKLKISKEING